MAGVVSYPGANNTFIPDHEASGKMVVDFSRNIKDFALNKYAQLVPSDKSIGYWLQMTVEEAGRILNTDASDLVWPDGNDAPQGVDGTESHNWYQYFMKRYAPTFRLGDLAHRQASWDVIAMHARIKAQQQMTVRTQVLATAATTSGNYDSSHVSAVASISGNTGTWSQSTTARGDIKRSINYAVEKILDDTLAAVKPEDLILVISSYAAKGLIESQEIVDYIKSSPDALAQIKGELKGQNENSLYGLPSKLYGVNLVIEKTRKVTSKKGATRAVSSVWPSTTALLCSRPGGLVGAEGAPSFSTLTVFVHKDYDMLVERKQDLDNKRMIGRVVDMFVPHVTAPASGFLFTSAVS